MDEKKKDIQWIFDITSMIRSKIKLETISLPKNRDLFMQYFKEPCQFVNININSLKLSFLFLINDAAIHDKHIICENVEDINELLYFIEMNVFPKLPKKLSVIVAYYVYNIIDENKLDDVEKYYFSYVLFPHEMDACLLIFTKKYMEISPEKALSEWIEKRRLYLKRMKKKIQTKVQL